jgi:hypothetical protein
LVDLSPGECVAMSWLSEMAALLAAAEQFPTRVLWLDFDRFLASPAEGLTSVLEHFGAADADVAAQSILAGPTMGQYAKAPTHRFDSTVRRQLLDEATRQHTAEIANGLSWFKSAAVIGPLRELMGQFAG